jgi:hypothetical protein
MVGAMLLSRAVKKGQPKLSDEFAERCTETVSQVSAAY